MQISQAARAYEFFIRSVCRRFASTASLERTILWGKNKVRLAFVRVTRTPGRFLGNHQISLTGIASCSRTLHSPAAQIGQTAWKSPASPLHWPKEDVSSRSLLCVARPPLLCHQWHHRFIAMNKSAPAPIAIYFTRDGAFACKFHANKERSCIPTNTQHSSTNNKFQRRPNKFQNLSPPFNLGLACTRIVSSLPDKELPAFHFGPQLLFIFI